MVAENNSSLDANAAYVPVDGAKSLHELAYSVPVAWAAEVQQSPAILAEHAELAKKHAPVEKLVTAEDLASIIQAVRNKCAANNVSATEIEKIVASISSNVGALKSQLDDITKQAMADANQAIGEAKDNFIQLAMNAEQSMRESYAELKQIDAKIEKTTDELYAEGLISKEDYERIQKAKAAAAKLPEGSAERIAADRNVNTALETAYSHAEGEAKTPEQREQVRTGQDDIQTRRTIVQQQEKIRNEQVAAEQNGHTSHDSIESPTTAASTTQNDVLASKTNTGSQAPAMDKDVADLLNAAKRLHVAEASAQPEAPSTTPSQPQPTASKVQLG